VLLLPQRLWAREGCLGLKGRRGSGATLSSVLLCVRVKCERMVCGVVRSLLIGRLPSGYVTPASRGRCASGSIGSTRHEAGGTWGCFWLSGIKQSRGLVALVLLLSLVCLLNNVTASLSFCLSGCLSVWLSVSQSSYLCVLCFMCRCTSELVRELPGEGCVGVCIRGFAMCL
jgi:hypothetical protein